MTCMDRCAPGPVRPGGWREGTAAPRRKTGWLKAECGESWFHGCFDQWPVLERALGLSGVDPVPFLRFYAPQIVLAAFEAAGILSGGRYRSPSKPERGPGHGPNSSAVVSVGYVR